MVDLTALRSELDNDPQALGYAAPIASGDHNAVKDLLNAVGGETVDVEEVPAASVQSVVDAGEYGALLPAAQRLWLALVGLANVPVKDPGIRSQIAAIWGAGTSTRAALAALQTKTGSRAEALFGAGTSVTSKQIAEALRL